MSTALLNRRRMMLASSTKGKIIFLEYVSPGTTITPHVQLVRSIADFEMRVKLDTYDTKSQLQTIFINDGQDHTRTMETGEYTTIGTLQFYSYKALKRYALGDDCPGLNASQDVITGLYWQKGTSTDPTAGDNQWFYWRNNKVEMYRADMTHLDTKDYHGTAQSNIPINEFWFRSLTQARIRRVEMYDGGVLVETFVPASLNNVPGLYSTVQEKFYPLA